MNATLQDHYLTVINDAITGHRVVQFKHNNMWRTIEPYMAGLSKTTHATSLYGFCRDVTPSSQAGTNPLWQVFNLTDIEDMQLTYYEFYPHPDYVDSQEYIHPVYMKLNMQ